jgi:hypothetical protein
MGKYGISGGQWFVKSNLLPTINETNNHTSNHAQYRNIYHGHVNAKELLQLSRIVGHTGSQRAA